MGKPKPVNFELISLAHDDGEETEPYQILDEIRGKYHSDITQARVALAWQLHIKPDQDGHTLLGKCIRVTDLQKEFADFDFIIVLNRDVWDSPEFTREKKAALLDHELCHAAPAEDEEGRKFDARGRQIFRTAKHDIEEFQSIVSRHGCYKRDLERFADALLARRNNPLFSEPTVSIGIKNEDGQMEYSTPIPSSEFSRLADRLGKRKSQ